MTYLLIHLLVLAAVAAAGVLLYAQLLKSGWGDDSLVPAPGIDYHALQAHWRGVGQARDWDSLRAQVRRWQEAAGAAAAAEAQAEQVARNLNAAVFRFAVPGEPLATGGVRPPAVEHAGCPARRRLHGGRLA
ncbi:hypothetical protein [Ramlibacter sp.]|uniref:hypothetical protein n=1 Tax=Ramlibacter sp. TaxID=1917967 RepID=UPI002B50C8DB|nr:hypothetical protein [Ramlibacter sp.]HWI81328.1 hypothetical protein [Ramlibacter sp.]